MKINWIYLACVMGLGIFLNACNPGATTASTPSGTTYAYIDDYDGNIYKCGVNGATGALINCVKNNPESGVNIESWVPYNITFNSSNGTLYGYISDYNGSIYQCGVNTSNGNLTNCTTTPSNSPWTNPTGVTFNVKNGVNYTYISDFTGSVYQCNVDNVGGFYDCHTTPSTSVPSWEPYSVLAFNSNSTYTYVTDYNEIYKCNLGESGGLFNCAITPSSGTPPWSPNGVTLDSTNGINYGYVSDESGVLFKCNIESVTGNFSGCSANESPEGGWIPYAVTFYTVNQVKYAYVLDQLPYSGSGDYYGTVFQCLVTESGSLTSCIITPASGAPTNWLPDSIVFVTM